ncbi:MAG: right-handed parallel beta-helix repeat-containing protein [Saprospiraceae bacterium]
MKHIRLSPFVFLIFVGSLSAQGLIFQDSVFTAPLTLSDESEFITFQNCRFVNITGDALTLNKSGAVIADCTFENITGAGIVLDSSEVYFVNDTFRNIVGVGITGLYNTAVLQGCVFSQITSTAVGCGYCDLVEVTDCDLADIGYGVSAIGLHDGQLSVINTRIRRVNGPLQQFQGTAINGTNLRFVEVESCTIDSCIGFGIYVDAIGIEDPTAESVKIQGNKISRADHLGIQGTNCANAIIRDNEISHPGFLGGFSSCIWWSGADARIEENHLHHAIDVTNQHGYGIFVLNTATIARNHIHDCTNHGIRYSILNGEPLGEAPILIFNNSIHDVIFHPIIFEGAQNEPIRMSIRNNTLQAKATITPQYDAPIAIYNHNDSIDIQGNILIYEGVTDTSVYLYLPGAPNSLITEKLNLKVPGDIQFVNYAGRDFHLASTNSPAYNFLPLNFGLPNDDFDGNPRIGQHDAGAFELSNLDSTCACTNCPMEIPDLFFGDFIYTVGDISNNDLASPTQGVCGVRIQFEHDYLGDITMQLISPGGQSVQLVGPTGFFDGTEANLWDVGFVPCNENASPDPGFTAQWNSNQLWGSGANYTGLYYPVNGCLEDFNTGSVKGDWTLRVFDNQASDIGVVHKFDVLFCDMANFSCQPCSILPQAYFTTTPIGAWSINLQNLSSGGATEFQIDFGDGFTASGPVIPSFHTYIDTGIFLIQLIAADECGVDTFIQSVHIQGALPIVFVLAEPLTGCSPLEVQLGSAFFSEVDEWLWLCPGGNPVQSVEPAPLITYTNAGSYPVTLIASNAFGSDTLDNIVTVEVLQGLSNPSFATQVIGNSIHCTNTTQNASSFFWMLNNGNPAGINTSPHVFEVDSSGTYTISLTVSDPCDTFMVSNSVMVIKIGTENLTSKGWQIVLLPNPNDGLFQLGLDAPENASASISILNALGEVFFSKSIQAMEGTNSHQMDLEGLPAGLYYLKFNTLKGFEVLKFVVR